MNPDSRYPFERTVCSCRLCTINCEHQPGALAPSDLPRIANHLGYENVDRFAEECLRTSDGAKVAMRDGRVVELPTLVPDVIQSGVCRFLAAGRCTIHAVSPFGCAYIDSHMTDTECRRRTDALLESLIDEQESPTDYTRLCNDLRTLNRQAPPLETTQYRLAKAIRKELGKQPRR